MFSGSTYDTRSILIDPPSPVKLNEAESDLPEISSNECAWNGVDILSFPVAHTVPVDSKLDQDRFLFENEEGTNNRSLIEWPEMQVDMNTATSPPLHQRPEEEEALLPDRYDNNTPLTVADQKSSLEQRLDAYKQTDLSDLESDSDSSSEDFSYDDPPTESVILDTTADDANYQSIKDDGDDEIPPSTPEDTVTTDNSPTLDLQESALLQLVIDHDSALQPTTSYSHMDIQTSPHDCKSSVVKSIPLIQPPPSEKLKKWLMSKPSLLFPSSPLLHSNEGKNDNITPSSFEKATLQLPSIITMVLTFLGDPAAVCRMKMVNRFCHKAIHENEHILMKDAVRIGGLKTTLRPAFWMYITLEKFQRRTTRELGGHNTNPPIAEYKNLASIGKDGIWHERIEFDVSREVYFLTETECEVSLHKSHKWVSSRSILDFQTLSKIGQDGKWMPIIERDVKRAFGNMPPHKTGTRLKADSIVRALVTWGRNRLIKRGIKGGGESSPLRRIGIRQSSGFISESPPPWENKDNDHDSDSVVSKSPTDTVSEWGGISPIGSHLDDMLGKTAESNDASSDQRPPINNEVGEIALSGNGLSVEKKSQLQDRLRFILYALSAAHEEVGYCQGMDYVVAHLLRVLQETIEWKTILGHKLPPVIKNTNKESWETAEGRAILVEEVVFRVMDTFLTHYDLRHFYWPELRCLKTACRMFEWLVHKKLPVLSDHFEHHELNVGLFALGWFQTLFLYIPAMPSSTINHMWDIWLVERSMKIFFRVATAILFLSQPILLNHDQEGMMIYLNTFPDATLLSRDILIPCALQIKVTNQMLAEIEMRVSVDNEMAHGIYECETIMQDHDDQRFCSDCKNFLQTFE